MEKESAVISSVIVQPKKGKKKQALELLNEMNEVEIIEKFPDQRIAILIEAKDSDEMMDISKKIANDSTIKSFDIAYYNTEMERT